MTFIVDVLLVLVPSVTLVAVTVLEPMVFNVTLKFTAPLLKAAFAGRTALASLEIILIVFAGAEVTRFQFASTAFTVTLNWTFVDWLEGVPVLPVPVPGAAVSPGASNSSLAKPAALTV